MKQMKQWVAVVSCGVLFGMASTEAAAAVSEVQAAAAALRRAREVWAQDPQPVAVQSVVPYTRGPSAAARKAAEQECMDSLELLTQMASHVESFEPELWEKKRAACGLALESALRFSLCRADQSNAWAEKAWRALGRKLDTLRRTLPRAARPHVARVHPNFGHGALMHFGCPGPGRHVVHRSCFKSGALGDCPVCHHKFDDARQVMQNYVGPEDGPQEGCCAICLNEFVHPDDRGTKRKRPASHHGEKGLARVVTYRSEDGSRHQH